MKTARILWNNIRGWLISPGFGKQSERELIIWDQRDSSKPIVQQKIDQSSGIMLPFFDEATQLLFIASKGEATIRYYELNDEAPHAHFVSAFNEGHPTRGITMIPKVLVNAKDCEIAKFYRTTAKDTIEPISFIVPRRSEQFQDDIYPPVVDSATPSLNGTDWASGQNKKQRYFQFTATEPKYLDADTDISHYYKETKAEFASLKTPISDKVGPKVAAAEIKSPDVKKSPGPTFQTPKITPSPQLGSVSSVDKSEDLRTAKDKIDELERQLRLKDEVIGDLRK